MVGRGPAELRPAIKFTGYFRTAGQDPPGAEIRAVRSEVQDSPFRPNKLFQKGAYSPCLILTHKVTISIASGSTPKAAIGFVLKAGDFAGTQMG